LSKVLAAAITLVVGLIVMNVIQSNNVRDLRGQATALRERAQILTRQIGLERSARVAARASARIDLRKTRVSTNRYKRYLMQVTKSICSSSSFTPHYRITYVDWDEGARWVKLRAHLVGPQWLLRVLRIDPVGRCSPRLYVQVDGKPFDLLDVSGGPVNKWVDDYRIACNGGGIALGFEFELPPGRHEIALRSCPQSESVPPTTSSNSRKILVPN
jgi:hypothetical protein